MIFGQPFETAFDQKPVTIKTYSLDAIMADLPTVPYQADALAEGLDIAGYDADGMIALAVVESYAADALTETQGQVTYRMAGCIKSDIHEYFYVADAALMKCNVRATYRMGGLIGYGRFADPIYSGSFTAKQSIIIPPDVNADDRFALERRTRKSTK